MNRSFGLTLDATDQKPCRPHFLHLRSELKIQKNNKKHDNGIQGRFSRQKKKHCWAIKKPMKTRLTFAKKCIDDPQNFN